MREFKVPNLVFSSSCTVYGQADVLPVTEKTPRHEAESPYGNTKVMSEDIIRDLMRVEPDMKALALRYFNPIGAFYIRKVFQFLRRLDGIPSY